MRNEYQRLFLTPGVDISPSHIASAFAFCLGWEPWDTLHLRLAY